MINHSILEWHWNLEESNLTSSILFYHTECTSHSAYVATDTKSNGAKIDGF